MKSIVPALALLSLTACSGDDGRPNPPTLWLALDGSELQVRLVAVEPPPF